MIIIEYNSLNDITVEFQDGYHARTHSTYNNFKKGNIKNPYDISVFGAGYYGVGKHKAKVNGKLTRPYIVWKSMIDRCYAVKRKEKFNAYYKICSVCDEWLCYQNFADWYENNKYEVNEYLHLDKDIISSGNKIYSPDKCLLVPQRINMIFTNKANNRGLPNGIMKTSKGYNSKYNTTELGTFSTLDEAYKAYSDEKKKHIIEVADEYKPIIPEKLYNALIAYETKIEDDKNYITDKD